MVKWISVALLLGSAVAFLAVKPEQRAQPNVDVNAVCGPAITKELNALVVREWLKPVHVSWSIAGDAMTVGGIYAQGANSKLVTASCVVENGKAGLKPLDIRN